jgi:hypothetical protein
MRSCLLRFAGDDAVDTDLRACFKLPHVRPWYVYLGRINPSSIAEAVPASPQKGNE